MTGLSTPAFRRKVFAFVTQKSWRSEDTVINHFTRWMDRGSSGFRVASRGIEDALFDLVLRKKLEWYGAEGRGDLPMKYRVPRPSGTPPVIPDSSDRVTRNKLSAARSAGRIGRRA